MRSANTPQITSHTLVKNEARFVWYSVMSVIEYVDHVLLWDTGSADGTVEILKRIKELYPAKVDLRLLGEIDIYSFAKIRQEMLDNTKTEWLLVNDGDEVWWEESIKKVCREVKGKNRNMESVVVPTINLVGDMYHYQDESAGKYKLAGRKGNLSLRLINRKISGLASDKPHGTWGWVDNTGKMIQDRDPQKILFVDAPYMHMTFLRRAGNFEDEGKVPKRVKKLKHEIGSSFRRDFYYPEVFFRRRPKEVQSPWDVMKTDFWLRSLVETPMRRLKRRILPERVGY